MNKKNENAALAFTIVVSGAAGALITAAFTSGRINALKNEIRTRKFSQAVLKRSFDTLLAEVPDERVHDVTETIQYDIEFELITHNL